MRPLPLLCRTFTPNGLKGLDQLTADEHAQLGHELADLQQMLLALRSLGPRERAQCAAALAEALRS